MGGKQNSFLSFAVPAMFASLVLVIPANAAFTSGGIETFNGTTLDAQTWATSTLNSPPTFTQNDGLSIHGYKTSSPYPFGGYTTKSPLVPVGGSVWAQVRVNQANAVDVVSATLALDTDPSGVSAFLHDSTELSLGSHYSQTSVFNSVGGGESVTLNGIGTSYAQDSLYTGALPLGQEYIYQIERLSSSNVRFSLFAENGPASDGGIKISFVKSSYLTSVTSAANMYVSLQVVGTDTTFRSVHINNAISQTQSEIFVPEPASLAPLIAILTGTIFRRRGTRVPRGGRSHRSCFQRAFGASLES